VWLIGVQREANEIKRNLANIPASIRRPRAADVATLRRGEFFACWGEHTVKTYVQPAWLEADHAREIARGERAPGGAPAAPAMAMGTDSAGAAVARFVGRGLAAQRAVDAILKEEDPSMCKEHARLEEENRRLQRELEEGREAAAGARQLGAAIARLLPSIGGAPATVDVETVVEKVLARIPSSGGGPIQVTPPAKLRRDFQEQETRRILDLAGELSPLQKRILKLLETTDGGFVGQPALAQRLGRATAGGGFVDFGKANKALHDVGLVEVKERQGVRKRLREKIAEDLAFYQPIDADVEAVYQNVLHAIATEGEGK
jgi:hypothetical protein